MEEESWWHDQSLWAFSSSHWTYMSPLTPAGTGFTYKCHSTWKVSILYWAQVDEGTSPTFTCATCVIETFWPTYSNTSWRHKLLGFPCFYQEPIWLVRRDTYSAAQQKLNQFALQWLGKAEVALFALLICCLRSTSNFTSNTDHANLSENLVPSKSCFPILIYNMLPVVKENLQASILLCTWGQRLLCTKSLSAHQWC